MGIFGKGKPKPEPEPRMTRAEWQEDERKRTEEFVAKHYGEKSEWQKKRQLEYELWEQWRKDHSS